MHRLYLKRVYIKISSIAECRHKTVLYAGVTYFKQLEAFEGSIYAITYNSKYVNMIAIHTYPYQAF